MNATHLIFNRDNVFIGGGVQINDSDHHSTNWQERIGPKTDRENATSEPITIGDHVFIGSRCIILKGGSIGEKSIVAAGSVVVRDIHPLCIAGRNPTKVLRYLFEKYHRI